MKINGWKYYNHAAKPLCAPHEKPDITPIENRSIWKMHGRPLFAKWTTEFDCGYETEWWYCIKDEPFDISLLKSKRRYIINKGCKYFMIKTIDPIQVVDELYYVYQQGMNSYPKKYRSMMSKEVFQQDMQIIGEMKRKNKYEVFVAYSKENLRIEGYSLVPFNDKYASLAVQKVNPDYEKLEINAALVYGILSHFDDKLESGFYICDGERNVVHETAFQDYLLKYFGFRKAYCRLHVAYPYFMMILVKSLYPFRNVLRKMDNNSLIHQINGVLKIEECSRTGGGLTIYSNNWDYEVYNKVTVFA